MGHRRSEEERKENEAGAYSVRASVGILKIIETQGGEIHAQQFTEWIAQLVEAGYLEHDLRDKENGTIYFVLTDKARTALQKTE